MDRLYQTAISGEPWMYRCPQCSLCRVTPIPGSLAEVYEDAYTAELGADRKNRRLAPDYFKKIADFLPRGRFRFLEVGGAYGWLAQIVRERFDADVVLLEPGRTAVRQASERGLAAEAGFVESYQPEVLFDVVCAAHVIEHVDNLESFLRACHRILKPAGLLILLTPNASAWKLARYGRSWGWAVPTQHTHFLSRSSAGMLVDRAGFETVSIREVTPDFAHYPFFFTRWLAERSSRSTPSRPAEISDDKKGDGPQRRRWPWRRWLARPLVFTEFLLLRALDLLHPSEERDELVLVARRR